MPLPMTKGEARRFFNKAHHGYDPYEKRYNPTGLNFSYLPHCVHFYYVGFENNIEDIRHYYLDNGKEPIPYDGADGIEEVTEQLAANAARRDHVPPYHGQGFQGIVWRRISYLVFLIDHDLFKYWPDGGIVFNPKNSGTENHSFFDAKNFEVDVPVGNITKKRSAICLINHMKKDNGGTNLDIPEPYSFSLVYKVGGSKEPYAHDPGGTNEGPSVPPPPL